MKMLEDPAPLAPLPRSHRVAVAAPVAIALVIGHDPKEHGAVGTCRASDGKEIKVSEYAYNVVVGSKVRALLAADQDLRVHDVRRHLRGGYMGMVKFVNGLKVDFALELHFNAAENPQAHGCEMLFWHRSEKSRAFAGVLQEAVTGAMQAHDRGIKPIIQGGRGAPFLNRTAMPAVIAEPFFGSNFSEMQKAMDNVDRLAAAYAAGLKQIAAMIREGRKG
jgi:N-acetylmuramoyl-L-alanine amidase